MDGVRLWTDHPTRAPVRPRSTSRAAWCASTIRRPISTGGAGLTGLGVSASSVGLRQPPSSANHPGEVKWWIVTNGVTPARKTFVDHAPVVRERRAGHPSSGRAAIRFWHALLLRPEVAVDVVALDLVRRAPEEAVGEGVHSSLDQVSVPQQGPAEAGAGPRNAS
ncbi:hypothetical protein [Nonomuraea sp. NPDC003201]